jgi:1,4-dihydroxy-6-naphthoate synthase
MTTAPSTQTISVAHSPDSDDAFMFYGLAANKLDTGSLRFTHVLEDIQSLNEKAMRGVYDVTAISFHAYAYIADKYALLPHGASIGDNYGPIVVSRERVKPEELARLKIAVPGTLTSAFLALSIFCPNFEYEVVPFDQIIAAVQSGACDAGLLIHEGQLFYQELGLHKVLDMGEWWHERTGLPLRWAAMSSGATSARRSSRRSRNVCTIVSVIRSTTAPMRWHMPCSLRATWSRNWPTASSECGSTN